MKSLLNPILDLLSVRAWKRMLSVGIAIVAALGAVHVEYQSGLFGQQEAVFACEQADEWRFIPGDEVQVISRLTLRQAPRHKNWMPVAFPFDNITIESASFDGESVPCIYTQTLDSVPAGWYLVLNRPHSTVLQGQIEVRWRFPASNLPEEGEILRMPLETLLPAWSYSVSVTATPDSGYRLSSQPGLDWNVPYTMNRPYSNPPMGRKLGSCGILARRVIESEAAG